MAVDSSFSSSLTLSNAADPAGTQVCLLQQTSATAYDGDGNVTAKIDAMGRLTATSYNNVGADAADYRGEARTTCTNFDVSSNYGGTFYIYAYAADGSVGTYSDYSATMGANTTGLTVPPATSPSLGEGWSCVGTLATSPSALVPSLCISDDVSVGDVCVLENTASTGYDADGDVASTIDAPGDVTATKCTTLLDRKPPPTRARS